MAKVIQLDRNDNVLIALADLKRGDFIDHDEQSYELIRDVPAKHKFVTVELPVDARIIMYGSRLAELSDPAAKVNC